MMKRIWALSLLGGIFTLMFTLSAYAASLVVTTIPQDDQLRKTGTMILCSASTAAAAPSVACQTIVGATGPSPQQKLVAEFKIDFALDGVNVEPDSLTCIVVQKEVCAITGGGKEGGQRQFTNESEGTNMFNISPDFECKYRKTPSDTASTEKAKPGVGVLDVYFVGGVDPVFIGDHILKVVAKKGDATGSEIQDICILDFPACQGFGACAGPPIHPDISAPGFTFPVGEVGATTDGPPLFAVRTADPIFPFASCKLVGLWQRDIQSPLTRVAACTATNATRLRGIQDP